MTNEHVWHEVYRVPTNDLRDAISYAKATAAKRHPFTIPSDLQVPIVKRRTHVIEVTVYGRDTRT